MRLVLGHAWLNLWDKHMTTGRINQVTCRHDEWLHHCAEQTEKGCCKPAPTPSPGDTWPTNAGRKSSDLLSLAQEMAPNSLISSGARGPPQKSDNFACPANTTLVICDPKRDEMSQYTENKVHPDTTLCSRIHGILEQIRGFADNLGSTLTGLAMRDKGETGRKVSPFCPACPAKLRDPESPISQKQYQRNPEERQAEFCASPSPLFAHREQECLTWRFWEATFYEVRPITPGMTPSVISDIPS